jgi:hypothetical protein
MASITSINQTSIPGSENILRNVLYKVAFQATESFLQRHFRALPIRITAHSLVKLASVVCTKGIIVDNSKTAKSFRVLNLNKPPNNPIRSPTLTLHQLIHPLLHLNPHVPKPLKMRHEQDIASLRPHPDAKVLPPLMPLGQAAQSPFCIVTQESTRDGILEAEPAFGFYARPVDGATAARPGQHNLPVKQRDHLPGQDGADDEGRAGPGDRGGAGFGATERVVIVLEVGGDGLGRCGGCVDGGVIGVRDGIRVDLVEDHDGGVLAGLPRSRWWRWWCVRLRMIY